MKHYRNSSGKSGVVAYESGESFIKVKFVDGRIYLYNEEHPGKTKVNKMKTLAKAGKGLSTYISQYIRDNYAEKL